MSRSIRINPLTITAYGPGERGTILVTRRFGKTEIFALSASPRDVAARLAAARGLFPGFVEFELADDESEC